MSDPTPVQPEQTPTPTQPPPIPTPSPEPEKPDQQPEPQEASSILTGAVDAEPAFDPEKITFPEGFTKEDALYGEFTELASEHKLSASTAQKLIDLASKQVKTANESLLASWDKQQKDWQAEIKADKEIGGDNLETIKQTFAKVANDSQLSDPGFRDALIYTGAGNHPAVVRTLARWAKALSEGGPVSGGPPNRDSQGNAVPNRPMSIGQAFYGETGPHRGGPKLS